MSPHKNSYLKNLNTTLKTWSLDAYFRHVIGHKMNQNEKKNMVIPVVNEEFTKDDIESLNILPTPNPMIVNQAPLQQIYDGIERSPFYQESFWNFKAEMDRHHNKNEPKPIVILDWYYTNKHIPGEIILYKQDEACGGCYYTNDKNFEKTADGGIIDITTHLKAYKKISPDLGYRPRDQYWMAWFRESPGKGYFHSDKLKKVDDNSSSNLTYDTSFNLTIASRRDADVPVHYSLNDIIHMTRWWKPTYYCRATNSYGQWIESDQQLLDRIMNDKWPDLEKAQTTWMVSNCNKSTGASSRIEYGEKLLKNGLKIDIHGRCFPDHVNDYVLENLEKDI